MHTKYSTLISEEINLLESDGTADLVIKISAARAVGKYEVYNVNDTDVINHVTSCRLK